MQLFGKKIKLGKRLKSKKDEKLRRKGFNFECTVGLANNIRVLALAFECPIYAIAEHVLELGLAEVSIIMQDDALKEQLIRHLAKEHVLVSGIDAEKLQYSYRAAYLKEAFRLLDEELLFKDTKPVPERLQARTNRILAAMAILQLQELKGVSLTWINQMLDHLYEQAQKKGPGQ